MSDGPEEELGQDVGGSAPFRQDHAPLVGSAPCKQDHAPLVDSAPSRHDHAPLVGSAPLLWRMGDVLTLRGRGLVGTPLGSLPRTPRQNGRLGRPVLLLPEEERLLRHAAGITPAPSAHLPEVEEAELQRQVERYQDNRRRSYKEQRVLALAERKSALLRAMTSSGSGSDEALRRRLEDLERSFAFPQAALLLQLNTARAGPGLTWVDRPVDPRAEVRYQVFKELRGRGFFLTSAGKFGGDFLVYPGDPLRFHAHFIAVCVSLDEPLALLDLLAVARLGSSVKKTVLLCSTSDTTVRYCSLRWSGMA